MEPCIQLMQTRRIDWPLPTSTFSHSLLCSCHHLPPPTSANHHENPTRFLPDKAIDLVDEAAAKLKMEITSKPEALDEIDRKVLQLEMERLSLQKVKREAGV